MILMILQMIIAKQEYHDYFLTQFLLITESKYIKLFTNLCKNVKLITILDNYCSLPLLLAVKIP